MRHIVFNGLKTPDGTILVSRFRHDFVQYKDKLTNKIYCIDGGLDYVRCCRNGDEELITVYSDEDFEKVRQYAYRFNRFLDNWVTLKDITDDWLENIIEDYIRKPRYFNMSTEYKLLFLKEKLYRAENEY
jgi:hypothetical protein